MRRNRPQNRGHRWYRPDLNIEQDRAYLIGRGFTYAVVARGEKRGRVVSAHSSKGLASGGQTFRRQESGRSRRNCNIRFGQRPT
jgi:hypothetical protein